MKRNKLGQFIKQFNTWVLQGKTAVTKYGEHEIKCDAADLPRVEKFKWSISTSGVCKYAVTNIIVKGKYRSVRMHRFILKPPKNMEVDHKDNNGLNNCRSNLRITKTRFNKRNLSKSKLNTSGFKGVHLVNKHRWQARITIDGKRIPLGCYATPIEAGKAYNEAALKYHGEFAHLNPMP